MSTEVIQTPGDGPPSPCDQLLDFAYGELEGDAQGAFERHLAGCARCQAELAAIERVRGAVRAVMPMVEPPSTTMEMGALHAQLLHAAAQRKPAAGGGKVLEFKSPWKRVQKVVMHPAFAAAAVFVLVGGVVGLQWKRSVEPAPMTPAAAAPEPAPAVATKTVAAPAATAAEQPIGKPKEEANEKSVRPQKDSAALVGGDGRSSLGASTSTSASASGKKGAPFAYRASKADNASDDIKLTNEGYFARREAKEAPKPAAAPPVPVAKTPSAKTNAVGGATSADDLSSLARSDRGETWNGQTRNWASPSSGNTPAAPPPKVAQPAPAPPPPTTTPVPVETEQLARNIGKGRAAAAPSTPSGGAYGTSAPSQAFVPQAAPQQSSALSQQAQAQAQTRDVRGPSEGMLAKNADGMRKKADELAKTGRCDEATQIYQQLEKTVAGFKLTVTERANLSHCRGQQGRMRSTQDELDGLKAEERQQQRAPERARDKKQRMPQDPMFDDAEASPSTVARPAPAAEAPAPQAAPTSTPPRKAKKAASSDAAY
jgi:hypothetical protein